MAISATHPGVASGVRTRPRFGKLKALALVLALVVVAAAIAIPIQAGRWTADTDAMTAALMASVPRTRTAVSFGSLDGLPAPVQRYLRLALPEGRPRAGSVRLEQRGRLRTGVESPQWLDFTATETMAPDVRGFVWDARLRLMPLVDASIRDSYVGGVGDGRIALFSAFTMSADHGSRELNSGELYRLLAEAPWNPSLLLPADDLSWAAIDDRRASATLTHGGQSVTIEFRFNDAGEVASVYAAARPRSYGTTYVDTPWEGRFSRYIDVNGMRVPSRGEVGWWVEGQWHSVWQGTIERVTVE